MAGSIGRADDQAPSADGVENRVSAAVGDGDPFAGGAKGDLSEARRPGDHGEALVEPSLEVPPLPPAKGDGANAS